MSHVTKHQVILALFDNVLDEDAFRPLLKGLPGLLSLCCLLDDGEFSRQMMALNLKPSMIILSSRLYPKKRPELVRELKELYPGVEVLLVTLSSDPLPLLQQLASDRVKHLLVTSSGEEERGSSLRREICKLLLKAPWQLQDFVSYGSVVHEFPLNSSRQKELLIAAVENAIKGDSEEMELLRQKASLLADEMVENALYGAPRGCDGRKLYRKGEDRVIYDDEKIVFRFAFDGETLAMEIDDGWGTLAPEMVVDFLSRNQEGLALEEGEAGGRGLFIIWRFLDHMHVNIRPGRQTVLGGYLSRASAFDCEGPRGFSISAEYHCS